MLLLKAKFRNFWDSIRWNLRCPNLTVGDWFVGGGKMYAFRTFLKYTRACSYTFTHIIGQHTYAYTSTLIMNSLSFGIHLITRMMMTLYTSNSSSFPASRHIHLPAHVPTHRPTRSKISLIFVHIHQTVDGDDMYLFDKQRLRSMFQFSNGSERISLVSMVG